MRRVGSWRAASAKGYSRRKFPPGHSRSMDRKLLDILCCPTSHQPLALLDDRELATVNQGIGGGAIRRADGSPQSTPLTAGLVTRDRRTIYRVEDGIPALLADEALAAGQWPDLPR